jgi:hypothetical protein
MIFFMLFFIGEIIYTLFRWNQNLNWFEPFSEIILIITYHVTTILISSY